MVLGFSFFGPDFFCRARLVSSSASYSSLYLKASSLKSLTRERGLKNHIQRTTFYLQRRSGAALMVVFVSAKFVCFSHLLSKMLGRAYRQMPISSNWTETCVIMHRACFMTRKASSMVHRPCSMDHRACSQVYKTCSIDARTCSMVHRAFSMD